MDLYREDYNTNSGMLLSKTVVTALYLCEVDPIKGQQHFDYASKDELTHLMNVAKLPKNEPRWTCRVWAKRVLEIASDKHWISLPALLGKSGCIVPSAEVPGLDTNGKFLHTIDRIELSAMATADLFLPARGKAIVFNNSAQWLINKRRIEPSSGSIRPSGTVPMEIDATGTAYLGEKPMQGVQHHPGRSGGPTIQARTKPMQDIQYHASRPANQTRTQKMQGINASARSLQTNSNKCSKCPRTFKDEADRAGHFQRNPNHR